VTVRGGRSVREAAGKPDKSSARLETAELPHLTGSVRRETGCRPVSWPQRDVSCAGQHQDLRDESIGTRIRGIAHEIGGPVEQDLVLTRAVRSAFRSPGLPLTRQAAASYFGGPSNPPMRGGLGENNLLSNTPAPLFIRPGRHCSEYRSPRSPLRRHRRAA
jgi:hypothetical protein